MVLPLNRERVVDQPWQTESGAHGALSRLKPSVPLTGYAREVARNLGRPALAAAVGALAFTASLGLASCSNGQDPVAGTSSPPGAIASAVQLNSSDLPLGWTAKSVGVTSQPGTPDSDQFNNALAGCMGISNPWSVPPLAEVKSKVFHDPTGITTVSVITQVDESSANAESRMAAIANQSYPECMSHGYETLFRALFKPLFKKYPQAELGPVAVQVAANPTSSGVRSITVSMALEIADDGDQVAAFTAQSIILQKGPVISRLGVGLESEGSEAPPSFSASLLEQLDDLVTTRLSEQVAMPSDDEYRDGEVLMVENSPGVADDYALRNVSCTVNKSDTMVEATGTFAGTNGRPLPALPTDMTYNVSVGVFDGQPDSDGQIKVDGVSASNEQTAYMNRSGRWSVDVRLSPNAEPRSCMYSVGTYGVTPPSIPITPPLPIVRTLT